MRPSRAKNHETEPRPRQESRGRAEAEAESSRPSQAKAAGSPRQSQGETGRKTASRRPRAETAALRTTSLLTTKLETRENT